MRATTRQALLDTVENVESSARYWADQQARLEAELADVTTRRESAEATLVDLRADLAGTK